VKGRGSMHQLTNIFTDRQTELSDEDIGLQRNPLLPPPTHTHTVHEASCKKFVSEKVSKEVRLPLSHEPEDASFCSSGKRSEFIDPINFLQTFQQDTSSHCQMKFKFVTLTSLIIHIPLENSCLFPRVINFVMQDLW
jgi:hypothetical protein